ncbi:hypothetical protein [Nitrosomonas sp. sh817]|uniref:hypothetical protein n=1 Tax=Nitrosomonas sp. sh817 TaxID=3070658 RepID=UPI0027DEA944|nr:hypothetical protein [Nitrosomonas sp. sh817]WMJ08863.1 hypothetical protein RBH92_01270 [Nitrosomonas sp. sh817]
MNDHKTPDKTKQPNPAGNLFDPLITLLPKIVRQQWFWFLAYGFNLVYFAIALFRANQESDAFTIPILPGVIFTCIIFVQIFADPIAYIPAEGITPEEKETLEKQRSHQRYKWMIFAYSFMLLSLLLTFYPFINEFKNKPIETLRDQPIAVFIGCSLDNKDKHLSCFKPRLNTKGEQQPPEKVVGTWVINIGGYINHCDEEEEQGKKKATACQVSDEHIATKHQPRLTQYEFREHLIFQIVQFISAPFLAILAYYLIEPSNLTNSVALAFVAGFASETILLMVRSVANKISPASAEGPQYGAIAGVIAFKNFTPLKTEVFLSESPQIHTIADDQGFFMLSNVPVGEHSISIKYTTQADGKTLEQIKKDTVKIERSQAIVKKNVVVEEK